MNLVAQFQAWRDRVWARRYRAIAKYCRSVAQNADRLAAAHEGSDEEDSR